MRVPPPKEDKQRPGPMCTIMQTLVTISGTVTEMSVPRQTRGQSNLTKSASRGAHSPVRDHPRGSKVVPLNSWSRVFY